MFDDDVVVRAGAIGTTAPLPSIATILDFLFKSVGRNRGGRHRPGSIGIYETKNWCSRVAIRIWAEQPFMVAKRRVTLETAQELRTAVLIRPIGWAAPFAGSLRIKSR